VILFTFVLVLKQSLCTLFTIMFNDFFSLASCLDNTGTGDQIQCSGDTASLLIEGGKEHWVYPREDKVIIKGKGMLTTNVFLCFDIFWSTYAYNDTSLLLAMNQREFRNILGPSTRPRNSCAIINQWIDGY
jgi:hypothetical protein